MNNVKVAVSFERIKVSEGGCVVDGQVRVSGVDVALLDADLRAKVRAAYNTLAAGIDVATALIQTPTELMGETRQRASALLADLKGQPPSPAQQQKLAELANIAEAGRAAFQRRLDRYVQEAGSTASPAVLAALADWQAQLTAVQTALGVAKTASTTGATPGLSDALGVLKDQHIEQTYLRVQKLVEGPSGSDLNNVDLSKGIVVFGPAPGSDTQAFDSWNPAQASWASRYQSLGSGYRVPWQALPTQPSQNVKAHLEQANGITPDKISFYGAGKTPLKAELSGTSWTIELPTGSTGEEGIYAYYNDGVQTPTTVGKLQVVRYENQQEKVKVVLVGGASAPDASSLQSSLNQIYGSSQTNWTVEVEPYSPSVVWDTDNNGLNAGDNATLSQYTSEMNALKRGYFQLHSQESNTYYVFVVGGFSPSSVLGYMPRGRGVGFISSGGDVAHTLAHELGHGAFGLEHTFDEVPQGSTDDLMDYASGSRLTHWQWQQIQHPGIIISWFEDTDEGMTTTSLLKCGCTDPIEDYSSGDGDCNSIIAVLEQLKAAYADQKNVSLTKPGKNPLVGQIHLRDNCYSDVKLSYVPDQSSLQIEPRYDQGASSFGFGNGGNTYLTISLTNPKVGQMESLKAYLFSKATTTPSKATFPVTGAQLKQVFSGTSQSRCDDVAALLNKYSDQFGLTNAIRMSHFIGQIGAETNLSNLVEGTYSASRIQGVWTDATRTYNGKTVLKYCDLFEGYNATQTSDCPFPYCDPPLYAGTTGLQVKEKYIKSTALFDYVYACRLGNGSIDSKDGSRFRGRGFMQLTGYDNYNERLQKNWDLAYGKGNKDFMCRSAECDANLELVETDLEIAMQTALAFWKAGNINVSAIDVSDDTIETVSEKVNGGDNGLPERKSYTKKAYEVLNK